MEISQNKYKMAKQTSLVLSFLISLMPFAFLMLVFSESSGYIFFSLFGGFITFLVSYHFLMRKYRKRKKILAESFPTQWEEILKKDVQYYLSLDRSGKERFQREIQVFLGEKKITGIGTDIDDKCRVLIAAGAIIPIFKFPEWEYNKIAEILVYPHKFDENFDYNSKEANILGLVDMKHTMIFSKDDLYSGFQLTKDKQNVGIHEFIHKIDEADGLIDGVPGMLMNSKIQAEWKKIVLEEMEKMEQGRSEINPYGLTDEAEFFSVASEYFFENPQPMKEKHPALYGILCRIFKQDTLSMFKSVLYSLLKPYNKSIGRNQPCPCGSGKKYKHCCLNA